MIFRSRKIIQWRAEGGCCAGDRAGSRRQKKATEWIDEKEELTLRSPDWGKEQKKRWQGNRPCGNVAPTKAASSLHENPLGLEEACWCRSRASKRWNVPGPSLAPACQVSTVLW